MRMEKDNALAIVSRLLDNNFSPKVFKSSIMSDSHTFIDYEYHFRVELGPYMDIDDIDKLRKITGDFDLTLGFVIETKPQAIRDAIHSTAVTQVAVLGY